MPKRTDISSILIVGAGPIIIGQACETGVSYPKGLSTQRRSIRNPGHSPLRPDNYGRLPVPQFAHQAASFPAFPISVARSSHQRYAPIDDQTAKSGRRRLSRYRPASVPNAFAWMRLLDFRSPLVFHQLQSSIARFATHCSLSIRKPFGFAQGGSAHSRHWYPAISQFRKFEIFAFTRRDILPNVHPIRRFDKVLDKFFRRHSANFGGSSITCRHVGFFKQRAQFSFKRTTISRRRKSGVVLDRVVNVSDGHSTHHQSPMIAMQSMYAMKAL
jgi:hypothetical protein